MKSYIKLSLTALAVLLFFNAFSVVKTNAQPAVILNEVLKRMDTHRSKLTSLKTNVKMVKTDVVLKESEVYEGTALYLPEKGNDALVRIDWRKPVEETLSVVDKQYVLYTPRLKRALTGKASEAKGNGKANNLFAFLSMSKSDLKKNYTVTYDGEETVGGSTTAWHLKMTPKNKMSYKSAEMWVDKDGMPIQIKIIADNNDTTEILLSGMQKNVQIKPAVFEVKLPRDTQIVAG